MEKWVDNTKQIIFSGVLKVSWWLISGKMFETSPLISVHTAIPYAKNRKKQWLFRCCRFYAVGFFIESLFLNLIRS